MATAYLLHTPYMPELRQFSENQNVVCLSGKEIYELHIGYSYQLQHN